VAIIQLLGSESKRFTLEISCWPFFNLLVSSNLDIINPFLNKIMWLLLPDYCWFFNSL